MFKKGIGAADLEVFADRAVYEDKDGKPLDPRSSLNELDAQARLIVEVPQQQCDVAVVSTEVQLRKRAEYSKVEELRKIGTRFGLSTSTGVSGSPGEATYSALQRLAMREQIQAESRN